MNIKRVRAFSRIVLGTAAVLLGLFQLLWAGVPDAVIRTLGIVILITLPVFAFVTVRMAMAKRNGQEQED
ncbi:MAG: hypothetical protein K2O45_09770 [Oscillospiraceae bacterium]|nr:hypothetical protein [Oscillospiraceae bacterium]